jgi:hypothetical protein
MRELPQTPRTTNAIYGTFKPLEVGTKDLPERPSFKLTQARVQGEIIAQLITEKNKNYPHEKSERYSLNIKLSRVLHGLIHGSFPPTTQHCIELTRMFSALKNYPSNASASEIFAKLILVAFLPAEKKQGDTQLLSKVGMYNREGDLPLTDEITGTEVFKRHLFAQQFFAGLTPQYFTSLKEACAASISVKSPQKIPAWNALSEFTAFALTLFPASRQDLKAAWTKSTKMAGLEERNLVEVPLMMAATAISYYWNKIAEGDNFGLYLQDNRRNLDSLIVNLERLSEVKKRFCSDEDFKAKMKDVYDENVKSKAVVSKCKTGSYFGWGMNRRVDGDLVTEVLARIAENPERKIRILEYGAGFTFPESSHYGAPWLSRILQTAFPDQVEVTVADVRNWLIPEVEETLFGLKAYNDMSVRKTDSRLVAPHDIIFLRHGFLNGELDEEPQDVVKKNLAPDGVEFWDIDGQVQFIKGDLKSERLIDNRFKHQIREIFPLN